MGCGVCGLWGLGYVGMWVCGFGGAPLDVMVVQSLMLTWAWPHELGQPVQWMRSCFGTSTRASTLCMIRSAGALVSMMASGQNCAPVHETMLPMMLPGWTLRAGSWLAKGELAKGELAKGELADRTELARP